MSKKVTLLIPAFEPSHLLVELLKELLSLPDLSSVFSQIYILNDGSSPNCWSVFEQVQDLNQDSPVPLTVLHHAVNLGKGAALRTGFNHQLLNFPESVGVVTADADGQHRPKDILRVGKALMEHPDRLILGVRVFGDSTPLRSKLGNELTKWIFRLFSGVKLSDTQTGLRGLGTQAMRVSMRVPLQGYDFELEMLLRVRAQEIDYLEVPIETVYLDGNSSSHFNPIRDSMRIYFVFFRYMGSSLVTACVDYLIFLFALSSTESLGWSQLLARAGAVAIAFTLARGFVFRSGDRLSATLPKFLTLVVVSGLMAWGMIQVLTERFGLSPVLAKPLSEGLLFFGNFAIQRELIFRKKRLAGLSE